MTMLTNRPPQRQEALRIGNLPGAEDWYFDWFTRTGILQAFKRDDPEKKRAFNIAGGVDSKDMAIGLAQVFVVGLQAARQLLMCSWPPKETSNGA